MHHGGRVAVVRDRVGNTPPRGLGEVLSEMLPLVLPTGVLPLCPHRAWWPVLCFLQRGEPKAHRAVLMACPFSGLGAALADLSTPRSPGLWGLGSPGTGVLLSLREPIPADCDWPFHFVHALISWGWCLLCPGRTFWSDHLCLFPSLISVLNWPSPQPHP